MFLLLGRPADIWSRGRGFVSHYSVEGYDYLPYTGTAGMAVAIVSVR